jgi:hypothetical protein
VAPVEPLTAPLPHDLAGHPVEEVLCRFETSRGATADDLQENLEHDMPNNCGVEARGNVGQMLQEGRTHGIRGRDTEKLLVGRKAVEEHFEAILQRRRYRAQ